jgi:hypothetical protein
LRSRRGSGGDPVVGFLLANPFGGGEASHALIVANPSPRAAFAQAALLHRAQRSVHVEGRVASFRPQLVCGLKRVYAALLRAELDLLNEAPGGPLCVGHVSSFPVGCVHSECATYLLFGDIGTPSSVLKREALAHQLCRQVDPV